MSANVFLPKGALYPNLIDEQMAQTEKGTGTEGIDAMANVLSSWARDLGFSGVFGLLTVLGNYQNPRTRHGMADAIDDLGLENRLAYFRKFYDLSSIPVTGLIGTGFDNEIALGWINNANEPYFVKGHSIEEGLKIRFPVTSVLKVDLNPRTLNSVSRTRSTLYNIPPNQYLNGIPGVSQVIPFNNSVNNQRPGLLFYGFGDFDVRRLHNPNFCKHLILHDLAHRSDSRLDPESFFHIMFGMNNALASEPKRQQNDSGNGFVRRIQACWQYIK